MKKLLKTIWKNLLDIYKDKDVPVVVPVIVQLYQGERLIDWFGIYLRKNHTTETEDAIGGKHDFKIKAKIV